MTQVFNEMHRQNLVLRQKDLFTFMNFRRTCTVSLKDFTNLLHDQLNMKQHLSHKQLSFFISRYRSYKQPDEVYFHRFMDDITYQFLKIGLLD